MTVEWFAVLIDWVVTGAVARETVRHLPEILAELSARELAEQIDKEAMELFA